MSSYDCYRVFQLKFWCWKNWWDLKWDLVRTSVVIQIFLGTSRAVKWLSRIIYTQLRRRCTPTGRNSRRLSRIGSDAATAAKRSTEMDNPLTYVQSTYVRRINVRQRACYMMSNGVSVYKLCYLNLTWTSFVDVQIFCITQEQSQKGNTALAPHNSLWGGWLLAVCRGLCLFKLIALRRKRVATGLNTDRGHITILYS